MNRAPSLLEQRARVVRTAKQLVKRYDESGHASSDLMRLLTVTRQLIQLEKNKEREIRAGKKASRTRQHNEAQWKRQQQQP